MDVDYVWEEIWKRDGYNASAERSQRANGRASLLRRLLGPNAQVGSVVELGCGDGSLYEVLAREPNWGLTSYSGTDRSATAIARAQEKIIEAERHTFFQADLFEAVLPTASADLVIACGLLEHVRDVQGALKIAHRACKPSGRVIFTMSNTYSMMYLARKWRELTNRWPYGYQRNYSPAAWTAELSQQFKPEVVTTQHGSWDFPISTAIDHLFGVIDGRVGRYIVSMAKPRIE